jgi:hypothetical protein
VNNVSNSATTFHLLKTYSIIKSKKCGHSAALLSWQRLPSTFSQVFLQVGFLTPLQQAGHSTDYFIASTGCSGLGAENTTARPSWIF